MVIAALKLLAAVLFVDFVSGLVHWMEDAYGNEELPVIGKLVTLENNLHHQNPAYFAGFGWWHNSWLLYLVAGAVGLAVWALGWLTWPVAVVLVLGANANQVHQWAHRSRRVNGPLITRLQRWGVLQSQRHHARHHTGTQDTYYCVLTPWLNPLLERVRFWRRLEGLIGVETRNPSTAPLGELEPLRNARPPREVA